MLEVRQDTQCPRLRHGLRPAFDSKLAGKHICPITNQNLELALPPVFDCAH